MHATFEWTHPRLDFREGTGMNHKLDGWGPMQRASFFSMNVSEIEIVDQRIQEMF